MRLVLLVLLSLAALAAANANWYFYRMGTSCDRCNNGNVVVDGDNVPWAPGYEDIGRMTITRATSSSPFLVNATSSMRDWSNVVSTSDGACTLLLPQVSPPLFVIVNSVVQAKQLRVVFFTNPSCSRPASQSTIYAMSGLCQFVSDLQGAGSSQSFVQFTLLSDNTVGYGVFELLGCRRQGTYTGRGVARLGECAEVKQDTYYLQVTLA
ncbi:hypothetical protein CAOG_00100 [Capsaspora owczarzaki ATCC 30864]|uniref:Fucolectin tachylectin-4 pentraxin-1 domain-containing protein n=1 Tax=Capsaspora owczarzaki (strain ATCC 30864) TaxID=595528 RepID=A0A0D2WHX4_CAPO3|nr:hypothetical protein CAOG_00100 [Capsaspora owczarzaki ATCC 30864]KJE88443.1 hypothetical protein CAOG_000100 [Capsaspora owczarzaki ATCC 30864]|eukprot:XP_004364971.1 hypothetical protein CAOG_00100 [Capsaspora owczarzaki ATCC 30864]